VAAKTRLPEMLYTRRFSNDGRAWFNWAKQTWQFNDSKSNTASVTHYAGSHPDINLPFHQLSSAFEPCLSNNRLL